MSDAVRLIGHLDKRYFDFSRDIAPMTEEEIEKESDEIKNRIKGKLSKLGGS